MSYLKMCSVAMAAAAVAVALAAAPASATVLCKSALMSTCSVEDRLSVGTAINSDLKGEFATIEGIGTSFVVHCGESTLDAAVTNPGPATMASAATEAFSFGSCSTSAAPAVLKNGALEFNWTSGNNATITAQGVEITVIYLATLDCVYGENLPSLEAGSLIGGAPAVVKLNLTLATIKGSGCPGTMRWEAEYKVTSPNPLYVTAS